MIPLRKGFTLIELLVVVGLVGLLATAALAIINPSEKLQKSRDVQRKSDLRQIQTALEAYNTDNNRYPAADGQQIKDAPWGSPWPPYMSRVPKDPLSTRSYLYQSDTQSYSLYAKLENCKDPQMIQGTKCDKYNYAVTSSNIAVVPLPTPTAITIALNNKHNFISLPVTPPDTNVATIISDIADKVEIIWYYVTAENKFISYVPARLNDLTTLEPGKGYWVKMKTVSDVVQTANLQIEGIPYEFQPISLGAGKYHMIGAPYTDVKLSDVIGTCTLTNIELSTINGDTGASIPIVVDSNTVLSSGKGYWIKSSAACVLSL